MSFLNNSFSSDKLYFVTLRVQSTTYAERFSFAQIRAGLQNRFLRISVRSTLDFCIGSARN